MRFMWRWLIPLFCLGTAAYADTISVGPLTFGGNVPFQGLTYVAPPPNSTQLAVVFGLAPGMYVGSSQFSTVSQSYPFAFDVAPGWAISSISLGPVPDYGWSPSAPFNSVGVGWVEQLTLCPAQGACTIVTNTGISGGAPQPAFRLAVDATPGTGILQLIGEVQNASLSTNGPIQADIYLTSVVPEPSTIVLAGTGVLGLLGLVRRRAISSR
ncbi:MAG: PEP-CTERM sorting domain-containing protein [Acidobacteriota bacterium]|nr:PEP-CTERM sorting domain-containing protein [Acidobacteriota bacterium]